MRARSLIGLDVGSRFVKAIQLSELKGRYTITQFGMSEISPGLTATDAIGELMSRRKFTTRRVVSAVSGRDVFVRFLTMAAADHETMRTSAKYEIGKFIPVDMEDVIHDSQALEDVPGTEERRVVLAAAKRAMIDEHVAMLEAARLQPHIVDVAAFALGNAYCLAGFIAPDAIAPGKVVAMADIGATRTTLHILRDETSFFTRELYKGSDDLSAGEIARETSMRSKDTRSGSRVIDNPTGKLPIIIVGQEDSAKLHEAGSEEPIPILIVGQEDATKMRRLSSESDANMPIVIVPQEDATKLHRRSPDDTENLPIVIVPREDATKIRNRSGDTTMSKVPILIIDPEDATKFRRLDAEVRERESLPQGAPMQDLLNEIVVSIEYFEAQHDLKVDKILLTGGGCSFPDLVDSLEKLSQRPVAQWNAVDRIGLDLADDAKNELTNFNLQSAIALGLAARIRPD